MGENYSLQMKGITKEFPGVLALNNVDFNLKEGEVHALIGENGAGKSSLIKILSGAHQMDRGEILSTIKKWRFKTQGMRRNWGSA